MQSNIHYFCLSQAGAQDVQQSHDGIIGLANIHGVITSRRTRSVRR